ncbi:MAG TPA: thiopurine S-methyltransferase [Steroidobacteraceae bacterium]
MDTDFWLERWNRHEIGFHQSQVNPYLVRHWPALGIANGATVFVPLCGKSLDMRWLHEQGHEVLGIDIARTACTEFFEEWGMTPRVERRGAFEYFTSSGIALLCGDFFNLQRADLANVHVVYDRAALNALPSGMREAYAAKLEVVLPLKAPILLITTDYDQQEMRGPPFAVGEAEIQRLFAHWHIELLETADVTDLPESARFRQRGLTRLLERVYAIRRSA